MKKFLPPLGVSLVSAFFLLQFSFTFFKTHKINILSPLPDFLTRIKNTQASTLSLWLPSISQAEGLTAGPQVTGRAALMYDVTTKKTLYSKNSKVKMPMASLTKVMTAVIALDNPRKDDRYVVRLENLVGESSMGLEAGETLTLKELLYGLVLNSANDATEVLATNYPGGREAFVKAMNDKAKSLGLSDTNFTNPSGLNGEGNQFTTAYDLMVITNYALANYPLFAEVASTVDMDLPQTSAHKEYKMTNETNLLATYPGVKGVKTGYTGEAGYCLITYLIHDNHKIIGILLGSENRREEMKQLLDYSLVSLGATPPTLLEY